MLTPAETSFPRNFDIDHAKPKASIPPIDAFDSARWRDYSSWRIRRWLNLQDVGTQVLESESFACGDRYPIFQVAQLVISRSCIQIESEAAAIPGANKSGDDTFRKLVHKDSPANPIESDCQYRRLG